MAKSLVIIDDSLVVRQRLRALFSRLSRVEVVGDAEDARSGLEMCRELRPDIVTLDVSMPGQSGLDILNDLRDIDPPPRIAVITHFPYPSFRLQSEYLGADVFISKTDPPNAIADAVAMLSRLDEDGPAPSEPPPH